MSLGNTTEIIDFDINQSLEGDISASLFLSHEGLALQNVTKHGT